MSVIGLDPGPVRSAFCRLGERNHVGPFHRLENVEMIKTMAAWEPIDVVVIERMQGMGMAVSDDVLETVHWAGRFHQQALRHGIRVERLTRTAIKGRLCGTARANDSNVRAALIDRWGGELAAIGGRNCRTCKGTGALGRPKVPCYACHGARLESPRGPLHGMAADCWAALAVALAWREMEAERLTLLDKRAPHA